MELIEPMILNLPRGFNKGSLTKIVPTLGSHSWERNHYVCMQTSGINMPIQSIGGIMDNVTTETSGQLRQKKFQTLIYSVEDSHVKVLVLQGSEEDFRTLEALCSMKWRELRLPKDLHFYSWKTSKDCLATTMAGHSKQSCGRLMNWGMTSNGRCLTARISVSRKTGKESTLSDILEDNPDQKYFLSPNSGWMKRIQRSLLRHVDMGAKGTALMLLQTPKNYEQTSRIYDKKGISPTIPTASGGHHIPMVCE